jgi:hypothetical protein
VEATAAEHAPGRPAKRPVAVTFIALLALVVGAYHAGEGIDALLGGGDANELTRGAVDVALGVLAIAIAFGAWRMRRWAWAAFMTWAVVSLLHQLLRHFFYGDPSNLSMTLDVVAVLVLTPLDVQIAFGVRPSRNVVLDHANPVDST